jgi:uncharacterized protein (TIGR02646 family)
MIHVSRPKTPPRVLVSDEAERARRDATEFFAGRPTTRQDQLTFSFDASILGAPGLVGDLSAVFLNKCSWCETLISEVGPGNVDHYRPREGALRLEGGYDRAHYHWLAYEWENLYLACGDCLTLRGSRFPVQNRRPRVGATGPALAKEAPYLLDPCADRPEEHLVFDENGEVYSSTDRGRHTIEAFNLNRTPLVEGRRSAIAEALATAHDGQPLLAGEASAPHAGARRQLLARHGFVFASAAEVAAAPTHSPAGVKQAGEEYRKILQVQESFSVEDASRRQDYLLRARTIQRVVIRNFRPIRELELDLATPTAERMSWLAVLGENGSGKSSVVQAIALALMGERLRAQLGVDAAACVRHGARRGSVEVWLSGLDEPVTLRFSTKSASFEGEPGERLAVLAYGATRLLARPPLTPPPTEGDLGRVRNLFSPFAPLGNATGWLLDADSQRFHAAVRALRHLLPLGDADRITRTGGSSPKVLCRTLGASVTIDELSDGYQSMVALAVDMMAKLFSVGWPAMEAAEGVVLLDELGAHLHPRWRMRVVAALRKVFPRLQFLVTTHEPLCLRGLADGEVVVLRRDASNEVEALTDLPPIEGLRVDQLLQSEFFGLNSTLDPDLDAAFAEYYQIKAERRPTEAQRDRLRDLEGQLEDRRVMGETERERLLLAAADEYVARRRRTTDARTRDGITAEAKQRLVEIWSDVVPERFRERA